MYENKTFDNHFSTEIIAQRKNIVTTASMRIAIYCIPTYLLHTYFYRYFFYFDSEVDLLAKGSTNLYKRDSLMMEEGNWNDSAMWLIVRARPVIY